MSARCAAAEPTERSDQRLRLRFEQADLAGGLLNRLAVNDFAFERQRLFVERAVPVALEAAAVRVEALLALRDEAVANAVVAPLDEVD